MRKWATASVWICKPSQPNCMFNILGEVSHLLIRKKCVLKILHLDVKCNSHILTGVMTTGKIVGRIFLATDQLLRVEKLAICASADLIHHSRLQIQKHGTRNMFPGACFAEEGVECVVSATYRLVTWHLPIGLQ